jgi:hypothetical protein
MTSRQIMAVVTLREKYTSNEIGRTTFASVDAYRAEFRVWLESVYATFPLSDIDPKNEPWYDVIISGASSDVEFLFPKLEA